METDVRWHHGQTLAAGQVAEFKVWAELVRQSCVCVLVVGAARKLERRK